MSLDPEVLETLANVTTATITTVLLKRGLRNAWMRRPIPLVPGGKRMVGPAFTLRFTPFREDLDGPQSWSSPTSTRAAVEAMPAGAMIVVDAMGDANAGIFGDILCARMAARGVCGLVTDGVVRDIAGVKASGVPVWCAGAAAPPAVASMHFVGWGEAIGCGGVTIAPNDIIVADDDGAVVIPTAMAASVASEAATQEALEEWIMAEIQKGAALPGLYPPNEAAMDRYRKQQKD
ncbi:MAG: ribonuclease activity regulator RraA [Alphaproteobacteria bacterium]